MKKRIFKIALASLLFIGVAPVITSCVDENLNVDPKHPSTLPSENFLGNSLFQIAYYITTPNVNFNNYVFFTQQLAETVYKDETLYNLETRFQPRNNYNRMSVYSIGNILSAKESLAKEFNDTPIKLNKEATLEIAELLVWENLVNTYGNIPYSEAFKALEKNYTPKYDDAKTIYIDLLDRLDAAIAKIDVSNKGYSTGGDFVFNGDMRRWKKTANAIKLRLGINLADVDPVLSKTVVESAYASGLYGSNDEDYTFNFDTGTFTNPFYDNFVASGRNDFIPSELVINTMKSKTDPRLDKWFTKVNGEFKGGEFGTTNTFANFSHVGNFFLSKDGPVDLISFTEISFILAEAAARGFNVGGTAESYYKQGIEASFSESNISGLELDTYLANNLYDSSNWKKSIGEQAYIALFTRGYAAWNFTRRLDYPILVNPDRSFIDGVPVRMPYSDQEYVLNKNNVDAAAAAIGGDEATTRLFWDIK